MCHATRQWNVHTGADSYGPATRNDIDFEEKLKKFAEMGFSVIQFHDDAVQGLNNMSEEEIKAAARDLKKLLDKYGLKAEFVAPVFGWIHTQLTAASCQHRKKTVSLLCGEHIVQ